MTKQISDTTKGVILLITSAFFFATMAVFVRMAGDICFVEKAFFRNAVAFLISLGGLIIDVRKNGREVAVIPKGAMLYLILRAVGGSVGIFGNFYAIDHLVLSDAAILNKMAPFFTIVFSYFFVKEKVKPLPFIAIIIAFLGSMLIVKPSLDFSQTLPTFAGFMGGVGAGLAYASVRKLGSLKCNGKIIIIFFSAFSMLLSVPYMLVSFDPMSLKQFLCLMAAGVCASGGQFTVTAAYYHAPAREISIYDYSQVIFSTILGFILFGMLPDRYSVMGYVIIISMAIFNFIYSKKQHFSEKYEV